MSRCRRCRSGPGRRVRPSGTPTATATSTCRRASAWLRSGTRTRASSPPSATRPGCCSTASATSIPPTFGRAWSGGWRGSPPGLTRMLLHLTGAGAVELAIKTAVLATGRSEVVGFAGGYHGTSLGALIPGGWPEFRDPFAALLPAPEIVPYGEVPPLGESVACVVVEPIQGRGGVVEPPRGFLQPPALRVRPLGRPAGGRRGVHRARPHRGDVGLPDGRRAARPAGLRQGAGRRPAAVRLPGGARADGRRLGRAGAGGHRHPYAPRQPAGLRRRPGRAGRAGAA